MITHRLWFNISLFHNKGGKANRHLIEQENAPIFLTVRAHDQGLSELEYLPGWWCPPVRIMTIIIFFGWTAPDNYSAHHIQPLVRFKFASQQRPCGSGDLIARENMMGLLLVRLPPNQEVSLYFWPLIRRVWCNELFDMEGCSITLTILRHFGVEHF